MLPDVICTCPKTFPARQKQENANAKATRNLRIEHPLVFIIRYFNNMVNEDLAARRLSLNWQRTPRNQQHYTTVGLVKKQIQICGNPAPAKAKMASRPLRWECYRFSKRGGKRSSLWKVMSSKIAARECQPGSEADSARTMCASVIIRTVPRPSGRSTRQTSISTGVPGSIRCGQRKRTPLELILVVRKVCCSFSRLPATRVKRNARLSLARA